MAIGRIPEPGTGIPESIIDAKGDIVTATAADTPARLAVGANETRLVADSAQSTGLKYVADTTNYAIAAKGDLLVGTGADTLAALTVGTNGFTLVADSSVSPTGLKWAAPAAAAFVGCNIYLSSSQSIATATATAIQFNAETFDTDNFHNNVTNNTRVTIPSGKGGKYLFTAWANIETNATGYRNLELLKNGTTLTGSWSCGFTPNATGYAGFSGAVVIDLTAGDYMEVLATQTSGSNKNVIGQIYGATGLSCVYLGA